MAVIYLRHPFHGAKVACLDLEAAYDEENGWERFDPTEMTEDMGNDMIRRRGRRSKVQNEEMVSDLPSGGSVSFRADLHANAMGDK